jgi:redox-sensitive bicupin YhaK (pirin superfamily)
MFYLRKSNDRGGADYGWLKTQYSFSFSEYYDEQHMGFAYLRVINDDHIAGGGGFPTHPHKNMEIVTYVISGAIAHKDSLGNSNQIKAGEIQRMSAGKGIQHSEFNPLPNEECHLLQIWIMPEENGAVPSYEQTNWVASSRRDQLNLIVAPSVEASTASTLKIYQKAKIWAVSHSETFVANVACSPEKYFWIQMIAGSVSVNGTSLSPGDGLGLAKISELKLHIEKGSEFLLFEMWQ